jgi:hypothetical protein
MQFVLGGVVPQQPSQLSIRQPNFELHDQHMDFSHGVNKLGNKYNQLI